MILQLRYSHMSQMTPAPLGPRKTPRQARSAVTVEAIHAATIQVLLTVGAVRLTTTRVAERAGVSVGTMYQYYPNKQALLFAIVEQHLLGVQRAFLDATERLARQDLQTIGHGLAHAWLDAKTADIETSRAIYGVAAEFDITTLMEEAMQRLRHGVARVLGTVTDACFPDVDGVAFMLLAMLGGAVRSVMELGASEQDLTCLRRELPRACYGYLRV